MTARFLSVLCAGLLLLQLASCIGAGKLLPGETVSNLPANPAVEISAENPAGVPSAPAAPSATGSSLPRLSELDALAEARDAGDLRQASTICANGYVGARDYLAASANIILAPGDNVTLATAPGGLEWLIFEAFNAGSECSSVTIHGTVLKPGYYFAVPDFATGRWNLQSQNPPGGPTFNLPLDEPRYYSAKHRQYFAILAVNGGQFQLEYSISDIQCRKPLSSIIDPAMNSGVEFMECSGLPGISYVDGSDRLVFALAKDTEPAGQLDWRVSIIDTLNYGIIQSMTLHNGKPVILYVNANDFSLWIAAANVAAPTKDSDWQHKELFPTATCYYCSIASSGEHLNLAWYEDDPVDSDMDTYWAYLHYASSDTADPLGTYSDYRLAAMGNTQYAILARPAIAIIDGLPAIAIVNYKPGDNSHVFYFQSSNNYPLPSDWFIQEFMDEAELPFVDLSEFNGRPLIMWRDVLLRAYGGKLSRPMLPEDWNYSELSGVTPFESFDWMSINERPFYSFVHTLSGPYEIATFGGAPRRFVPQDDIVEEIQTLVSNSFETIGNPVTRLAAIAGQPVTVYFDPGDGSLHYVRHVIDESPF